jgi:hypothetical protein
LAICGLLILHLPIIGSMKTKILESGDAVRCSL